MRSQKLSRRDGIGEIVFFQDEPVTLSPNQTLLWESAHNLRVLSWNNWDGSLRVKLVGSEKVLSTLDWLSVQRDTITCCNVSRDGKVIVCGAESSLVRIWRKQARYMKKYRRRKQQRQEQKMQEASNTPGSPKMGEKAASANMTGSNTGDDSKSPKTVKIHGDSSTGSTIFDVDLMYS